MLLNNEQLDAAVIIFVSSSTKKILTGSTIMRNKSGHVNAGKTTSKFVGVIFH